MTAPTKKKHEEQEERASRAIGVFDSGVGGLTVLRAIEAALPNEAVVYLGDTARVPYGTRSKKTIVRYALNNARTLLDKAPLKALVVACNTVSAVALDALREAFAIPVVGVIEPGARRAIEMSKGGTIVVLGTAGTIRSRAYPRVLENHGHLGGTLSRACPLLVPLVEEGWTQGEIPETVIAKYLAHVGLGKAAATDSSAIDTIVLGCTHYPLLRGALENVLRRIGRADIEIVDGGEATALEVAALLDVEGLRSPQVDTHATIKVTRRTFVTDAPEQMAHLSRAFLGREIAEGDIELVDVLMSDVSTLLPQPSPKSGSGSAST